MFRNEVSAAASLNALVEGILASGNMAVIDGSLYDELGGIVDQSQTEPKSPEALLTEAFAPERRRLLDFGCGTGGHRAWIDRIGYDWRGVNYKEGMATSVREIASQDSRIEFYDGLHLPYSDHSFDIVYSFQTFEHIQDVGVTFSEIRRVLRPGGLLIGAVSYLEQIHDYSTFNFTPYGLKLAAQQAGMKLDAIYPSYDVFTWMLRRLLIVTSGSDENSLGETLTRTNSIHNAFVSFGKANGLSAEQTNLLRLMFSAHMTFLISAH